MRDQPLSTWKEYLAFRAVESASTFLPKAFADEQFAFYGKVLSGTPKQSDRWKRAVEVTDAALGEAVGKLYVAKYFPPSEKARAEAMVRNEIAAFAQRIDRLDWMSPATKAKAKDKLAILKVGVGYPDRWRDYSGLEVVAGDALGNAQRASLFEYHRNLAKLGQPVDRGEWVMNPQLVNAVNLPAMNAMNFPAAILQPPYFDPNRPEVMDYGAIGATIGHEISHSFDDQGALFDAEGRLTNWWTKEDFAHFEASAAKLVGQYDAYRPFPDLAVNGKLTLSENIADVAGLATAYDAWRLSLGGRRGPGRRRAHGGPAVLPELRPELAARRRARRRCASRIVTDAHAPGRVPRRLRAQPRRLVRGVRREAGAEALSRPGGARADLVGRATTRISDGRGPRGKPRGPGSSALHGLQLRCGQPLLSVLLRDGSRSRRPAAASCRTSRTSRRRCSSPGSTRSCRPFR